MSYELGFHPDALEEWRKLDTSVREVFKKKLVERLLNPRVPAKAVRSERPVQDQTAERGLSLGV